MLPYFPEPIRIKGNVTEERYRLRTRFVRRVILGHYVTVLLAAAVALTGIFEPNAEAIYLSVIGGLILLTVIRALTRGGWIDALLSCAVLVFVIWGVGHLAIVLMELNWPMWAVLVVATLSALYTVVCGRDFSFMGHYVITLIAWLVIAIGMNIFGLIQQQAIWSGLLIAALWLGYLTYDTSMLLWRRRLGEEVAAVADLYRDTLNFITYPIRVAFHWRRYRSLQP